MTIGDLGSIGSLLAAVAVFITLIYLSRQVRQGNVVAKLRVRQTMSQHDIESLDIQRQDTALLEAFRGTRQNPDDYVRLHYFLVRCGRQREWEWYQHMDGVASTRSRSRPTTQSWRSTLDHRPPGNGSAPSDAWASIRHL